jgi:hypothetical protein
VAVENGELTVAVDGAARSVVVYRVNDGAPSSLAVAHIVPARAIDGRSTHLRLDAGRWAVSVIDRRGVESRGAPLVVSAPGVVAGK